MSQDAYSESPATVGAGPVRRIGIWTPIVLTILAGAALTLPTRLVESPTRDVMMIVFMGPAVCFLVFLIWWLAFSKATWNVRLGGLVGAIAACVIAWFGSEKAMQLALSMYLPFLLLFCWTIALISYRNNPPQRWMTIPIYLLPAAFICMLFRFEGVSGEFNSEFNFRWAKTKEQEYLASRDATKSAKKEVASGDVKPLELAEGDWPGFRGTKRDSIVRGVKIRTDWNKNPPKELWRSKIGPGWSAVTVVGDRVFTQEQRGEDEAVVCLSLKDGKEIWSHVDKSRFEEAIAGAGPRATPTFDGGRLFTVGGKGVLNAFDAASGKLLWSHDLVKDYTNELKEEIDPKKENPVPMWGFSGSPLVYGDKVAVYVGGKDKGVAVYNAADGKLVWSKGIGGHSYTSVHFAKLAGADALLNTTNHGLEALDPATGKELWNHEWEVGDFVRCVQPGILSDGRVAVGTPFGKGTRIVGVEKSGDAFATKDNGTFEKFSPYFSDYVLVDDVAYGFDGHVFVAFDLKANKKLWKGGRYGSGQVLLLADQNLLLVVSETDGNVVLIPVDKSGHKEIARFKALTGKTWNHPVVAHGKLIVRNGEEIACFDVAEK